MRFCLFCLLALLCVPVGFAQPNRIIPVDDWTYTYINRLQRRGHLLELAPTALPYREGEVAEALAALDPATLPALERRWLALLNAELTPALAESHQMVAGIQAEGGVRVANNKRLDPLRPLGSEVARLFQYASLQFRLDKGPFIAQLGARHDLFYDQDPDGLDTANRLWTRGEDNYIGYRGRFAQAYLGRFANHWGINREDAVIVSSNPRSFDQLNLRLGGQRFSVQGILGELDSITGDGRFTGIAGDDSVATGSERRYFAAHRWHWRPSKKLSISLVESAIYSGGNAGVSLKYLNPLTPFIFAIDNTPKNDENNGTFAGILWAQVGRLSIHGQLMFDDFDALGVGEPVSLALTGSATLAAVHPNLDLGGLLTLVTARTYNTIQPEGKYLYLLRGLGTQFNDYVHAALFADWYLDAVVPGLTLTPRLDVLAQGERDPRLPFPFTNETASLLNGTIERTVRAGMRVFYQPQPYLWARLDLGANFIDNLGHVEGVADTRIVGLLEVGMRISLDKPVSLGW